MKSNTCLISGGLIACMILAIALGAQTTSPYVVHTGLYCAEQGESCLIVSGSYDRDIDCESSTKVCQSRHGTYGLFEVGKADLGRVPLAEHMIPISNITETYGAGRYVVETTRLVVGDTRLHALWTLRTATTLPTFGNDEVLVLHSSRSRAPGKKGGWTEPDTLQHGLKLYSMSLDAVESDGEVFSIITTKQDSIYSSSLQLIRIPEDGDVEVSQLPAYTGAYPQVEVIEDTIQVAFMGGLFGNMRGTKPQYPDGHLGASVFLISRHVDSVEWQPTRLVYETGRGSAHYIQTRVGEKGLEVLFMEEITEGDPSMPDSQLRPPYEKVVRNVEMTSPRAETEIFRSFNSLGKWCLPIYTLNTNAPVAVVECEIGSARLFLYGDSQTEGCPVTASGEPFMMLSPTYYIDRDGPKMSFIEFKTETPVDRTSIHTIDLSETP